jgi:predicted XRE-type DNA-binding protein
MQLGGAGLNTEKIEYEAYDAATLVKQLLEIENVSQKELADKMGCVRQNVSQSLNRGSSNMRYDTFKRMVDTLGYEVVVRKK